MATCKAGGLRAALRNSCQLGNWKSSQASECLGPRAGPAHSLRTQSAKATSDKVLKSGEGRGGATLPGASTSTVPVSAPAEPWPCADRRSTATQRRRSGSGAWQLAPEHHWNQHVHTGGSLGTGAPPDIHPGQTANGRLNPTCWAPKCSALSRSRSHARHKALAPKGTRPRGWSGVLVNSTALALDWHQLQ